MNIELLILAASSLGALCFFASGYLFGSRPSIEEVEDDLEPSPPFRLPEPAPVNAFAAGESPTVQEMLGRLRKHYQLGDLGLFDADGLLVFGAPTDCALGLQVASFLYGQRSLLASDQPKADKLAKSGAVSIYELAHGRSQLWLAAKENERSLSCDDRERLARAVARELYPAQAA